ncbi:MAG: C25 family cysteine peptidase [Dysgonamonadaceae bacterium]|jgi:hypothetical protein|nr:C25 family cysteine peptidase [Dysgonamonadaceae bacterium]
MKTKIIILTLLLTSNIGCVSAQLTTQIRINEETVSFCKEKEYDHLQWGEGFYTTEIGAPELPISLKSYLIPIDAKNVKLSISNIQRQVLEGKYYVYPIQPPAKDDDTNPLPFTVPNKAIYDFDKPYPGKQAEIISDYFYMGYRIITVQAYPFEYIPKTKTLYACDFDFSIDYLIEKQSYNENTITQYQSFNRYELNKKSVKFRVENPEAVDGYDTKVSNIVQWDIVGGKGNPSPVSKWDTQIPDYIIITNNALKPAFQPLADWKTKKGVFTLIQTVEEIAGNYQGSDLSEKIRNYIINARFKWGDGLYILLGGDVNVVPARMLKGSSDLFYPADMYYATYIGSWNENRNNLFKETGDAVDYSLGVILGRASVENMEEATVFVNKIITYEKAANISDLNYFKNNLYSVAYMAYSIYMNSTRLWSYYFMQEIKNYTNTYVSTNIRNKFITDNANCLGDTIRYSERPCPGGDIELNHDNFLSTLNSGANLGIGKFHFIYHKDHGSSQAIGTSSIDKGQSVTKSDIMSLTNGPSYQIFMSGSCKSANFKYDCIAEAYLTNSNGGGVAYIGNTDDGYRGEYPQLRYFCDALYVTTNHPSIGRYDIGSAFQNIIKKAYRENWRLHLLGDPEMQVWTDVPQNLNVSVSPATVLSGSSSVTVSVSNIPAGEEALICLMKANEVYATMKVNANGSYTIPFTAETPDTLHVTVTAHNRFPVEKTVTVNPSKMPNLLISALNFTDNGRYSSVGNGNGQNDAGETIYLQVAVGNNGGTVANGVTATLSCTSDSITFLTKSSKLGDIASGASARGNFLYRIHKDMHETLSNSSNPVTFQLNMTGSDKMSWSKTFNIDVFAAEPEQRNKVDITPATIGANQTVTFNIELQNRGQGQATGLTAVLTGNNASNVVSSCSSDPRTYPAIGRFETQTASTPFQFTTASGYRPDSTLKFNLEVTNAYGRTWNFSFDLTRPAAITGLDFLATENTIDLQWNALSGVGGYNVYRCNAGANDTESGSYVKLNTEPVSFSFFNDAGGLNTLAKYYYKVAAVSPSGMEGNAVRILAWTSYPQRYLYPVTFPYDIGAFRSPVNVADVNFDGKKEIFASTKKGDDGYLVALDYEGSELFDIDNNVTTYSGFADLGNPAWAIPALADLKREGKYSVILPTRNETNKGDNRLICYSVEDANGDSKPDLLWSQPLGTEYIVGAVVSNIDNSPDGSMEILVLPVTQSGTPIRIYNADGTLLRTVSPGVSSYYAYGSLAVADLDDDGDKEIILACNTGIYVWHHDGSNFIANKQPIYDNGGAGGFLFKSSVVVCDLNADGNKDILTCAIKNTTPYEGKIYAVNKAGGLLSGWGTSVQTIPHNSSSYRLDISVGDLDNDGKLEVVAFGLNTLKIWKNTGALKTSVTSPEPSFGWGAPVLADVDGDADIEVIAASGMTNNIYGYNHDGSKAVGFPLRGADVFYSNICIDDVDNDGRNELIAVCNNTIQMWKTSGLPSRIAWGRDRHDRFNTGEYYPVCDPVIVSSNTSWNSDRSICSDLIVRSGTLTVNSACTATLSSDAMIILQAGSTLVLDGGKIMNASIKALPGSKVILKNNAYIQLCKNGELSIASGAEFENSYGKIDITY